jgi:hypothetical protein
MGAGGMFAFGEDVGWRFIMHEAIAALESIRGRLDVRGMRRFGATRGEHLGFTEAVRRLGPSGRRP